MLNACVRKWHQKSHLSPDIEWEREREMALLKCGEALRGWDVNVPRDIARMKIY